MTLEHWVFLVVTFVHGGIDLNEKRLPISFAIMEWLKLEGTLLSMVLNEFWGDAVSPKLILHLHQKMRCVNSQHFHLVDP